MPEKIPGPCALDKVVKADRCDACKKDLAAADLKEGACAACGGKPTRVEYCQKTVTVYTSACEHQKTEEKPFTCCGKSWSTATKTEDRIRVSYQCASCKASAEGDADLKHEETCKTKSSRPKKVCSKSGTPPHATPPR